MSKKIERRKFLKTTAAAGVGATAATLAAPAISQGREKLTMVTTWGRGLAGVFDAAQRVADSVNAMSDGTLEIEVKAQGELVSGLPAVFDAVTSGQADMYHGADYYYVGQHAAFGFFTAVPFGMTATELNNWYYHMGGHQLHLVCSNCETRTKLCRRYPWTKPVPIAGSPLSLASLSAR